MTEPFTLRDWGRLWLEQRARAGLRSSSTERTRWALHVERAPIAEMDLGAIRAATVRGWLDAMLSKMAASGNGHRTTAPRKLSRQTVRCALVLLRTCLRAAVEHDHITESPAASVRMPRSAGTTHEPWTYLTMDEQRRLLSCAKIPRAERLIIAFALGTGLRQGEQWALELRDVHVDVKAPHVVVRYGSFRHGERLPPKSGKIRRIPLFGVALEAARTWLGVLPRYVGAHGNPHGLAFPTARGARRSPGKPAGAQSRAPSRRYEWRDWLDAAGLAPTGRHDARAVRWHDLRHSCASSLIAGWWGHRWTLDEVRKLLGHGSVTITERYAHLADSALAESAAATSGVGLGATLTRDRKKKH